MRPADFHLLTVVAEPLARKTIAKAYSIPSGAIPVLAAIGFRANNGDSTRPCEVYGAKLGAETLIRSYVAKLVKARLVERLTTGRIRLLRLTMEGRAAVGRYERALREGVVAFGQIRPQRVLTSPLPLR
jgi:hypothetical protein